jgi:hypothetical protein
MATQTIARKSRAKLALIKPDPVGSIRLNPDEAEQIRIQLAIIMHHRQIMTQMEAQLTDHIETTYGVSVRDGGGYSLNTAEGRLDRTG